MEFAEHPAFTKAVLRFLDEESYLQLQLTIVARPDVGAIIPRSGGLRNCDGLARVVGRVAACV